MISKTSLASAAPIMESMEAFEASGSVAKTGTGTRREGETFEHLVRELWSTFATIAVQAGAKATAIRGLGKQVHTRLEVGSRSLYVPAPGSTTSIPPTKETQRWLDVSYKVSELIEA